MGNQTSLKGNDMSAYALAIRIAARKVVGPCSDYQIMFCASAANVIQRQTASLEDLTVNELRSIVNWVVADIPVYSTTSR